MAAGIAVTGLPAFGGDTTSDAALSKTAANLVPPDWIAPGKLRWVWALWEPMALYRRGGMGMGVGDGRVTGHWVRRWYDRMHGDEILDKLADAGVNLVTTHFYRGFGLAAEAGEKKGGKSNYGGQGSHRWLSHDFCLCSGVCQ